MDNNDKLRPLYLAKILYEHTDEDHFLTTVQLINMLQNQYGIKSHRQTIKSDIQLLKDFGMEIQEVKSTQNRYNICGRQFDTPELKLLIDAVESSKFITVEKSKQLVDKICTLTSKYIAPSLKRNVTCEDRIKLSNEKVYIIIDAINEAINENKKIGFRYFRYNEYKEKCLRHNGETYVITPIKLVWNGDFYYLVGIYDESREVRVYRVDRIVSRPEIVEEDGVAIPDDFNIETYLNTTFRMFGSEYTRVELVCDNDLMDSIIDRFGEDVETSVHNMNSFNAVVDVAVSHVFYSWVFGFGGKVKIRGPKLVREGYAQMVKEAAKKLSKHEQLESDQNIESMREFNKTIAYYDKNAEKFIESTADVEFHQMQDKFLEKLEEGAHILDFGCGSGRDTKYFLENGYQVEAIDGSLELCKLASEFTGIEVKHMLFQELSENAKYDGIWACSSILHLNLTDLENVMKKMMDAIKANGIIYTSFKYGTFFGERNGRYFTDMTEDSFAELLNKIPELKIEEQWVSSDVRPGRGEEKWLNLILRKN